MRRINVRLEVKWRRGGEEKIENIESLIFLGSIFQSDSSAPVHVAFIRGPKNQIGELFTWGSYSWPILPFEPGTKEEIEFILRTAAVIKWGPNPSSEILTLVSPEIHSKIRATGKTQYSSFNFYFDDERQIVSNIGDCLLFIIENGKKKFAADGWGSEKKSLLFFGAETLYGAEVRDRLKFAIWGPLVVLAERMLDSFRSQGRVEGKITLTPEAWAKLEKDKYLRETKDGPRKPSDN